MKHSKNTWIPTIHYYSHILFALCTVIAIYGIVHAPASDAKELEADLLAKAQMLQQEEDDPTTMPQAKQNNSVASVGSQDNKNNSLSTSQAQKTKENSTSVPSTSCPINRTDEPKVSPTISVIGDSVFLGASSAFRKLYNNSFVNAKISRQVVQALDVAKDMNKQGKLGDTVIIALGTNGNFNSAVGQKLINYLGKDRTIYWIDVYGKDLSIQNEVNTTIDRVVSANKNVHRIYWSKEGAKHPDWFYQDGIHLNPHGEKKYAKFILEKLQLQ